MIASCPVLALRVGGSSGTALWISGSGTCELPLCRRPIFWKRHRRVLCTSAAFVAAAALRGRLAGRQRAAFEGDLRDREAQVVGMTSLCSGAGWAAAASESLAGPSLPFLYGTAWKKEATADLVVQAVREGFRGIDTACQPKHYREDLVGAALSRLATEGIPREQLWLQTKFTPLPGQDPNNVPYDAQAPLPVQAEQSIERSLQNLGTHRIDSLVLHSPLPTLDQTLAVWTVFERAVDAGKVGQLGISNCYEFETFKSLYERARIKPRVLQNRFYADSGYDADLRAYCLANGVKYQSFWTLSANPHILKAAPVQRAAGRLGVTPAQVLFCWLIQSGHQPLTGTKSPEHMRQDLQAANLRLTGGEMSAVGELFRSSGSSSSSGGCVVS